MDEILSTYASPVKCAEANVSAEDLDADPGRGDPLAAPQGETNTSPRVSWAHLCGGSMRESDETFCGHVTHRNIVCRHRQKKKNKLKRLKRSSTFSHPAIVGIQEEVAEGEL